MRRNAVLHTLGCALIAVATFAVLPATAQQSTPNVVFILFDNVGYGDLGPYGGRTEMIPDCRLAPEKK